MKTAVPKTKMADTGGAKVKMDSGCNALPDELWLGVFKFFHPIYDDVFILSRVCKQWRSIIIKQPDPSLWESIELANIRSCYLDSPFLSRFTYVLKHFGKCVKVLSLRRCHCYFSDVLKTYSRLLCSLQVLEITGMTWNKTILRELSCVKSLRSIKVEATGEGQCRTFMEQDLTDLAENFPRLEEISLQYSVTNGQTLNHIQDIVACQYSYKITDLHIERARVESLELADILQNLIGLRRFSYGNDEILGLPSIQQLHLKSTSIRELELFQIGDFAEFCIDVPYLQKLSISFATSLQKLSVYAPSLRVLNLLHCSELRKISKVSSSSLRELIVCKCSQLSWSDLIRFLVRNPDIKSLKIEVNSTNIRLDQNSNPSLKKLQILDSGANLMCVDIRCPKLKVLTFRKSVMHSSMLKMISVRADEMDAVIIKDVPHIRKIILNVPRIKNIEIDFDRRFHQIKPLSFTTVNFPPNITIQKLTVKKLNLQSIALSGCHVQEVILDSCNLDASLSDILQQFGNIECLTVQNSYGPCQIIIQSSTLKELRVSSCSSILMDHLHVLCPVLEKLYIHGSTILPSKKELEITANALKKLSPQLLVVNFSQ